MGQIEGEKTVEIDAPVERCFEIAADIENAPDWQGSLQDVEVLERDGDGRAELVETKSDAKVKSVRALLRFSYTPPTSSRWPRIQYSRAPTRPPTSAAKTIS